MFCSPKIINIFHYIVNLIRWPVRELLGIARHKMHIAFTIAIRPQFLVDIMEDKIKCPRRCNLNGMSKFCACCGEQLIGDVRRSN
jgi:hypothetical protein